MKRKLTFLLVTLLAIACLTACGQKETQPEAIQPTTFAQCLDKTQAEVDADIEAGALTPDNDRTANSPESAVEYVLQDNLYGITCSTVISFFTYGDSDAMRCGRCSLQWNGQEPDSEATQSLNQALTAYLDQYKDPDSFLLTMAGSSGSDRQVVWADLDEDLQAAIDDGTFFNDVNLKSLDIQWTSSEGNLISFSYLAENEGAPSLYIVETSRSFIDARMS